MWTIFFKAIAVNLSPCRWVTAYKVERIEREQYDCHLLRIAWYDAKSKRCRDQAVAAPDAAVDKFIEIWTDSERHKKIGYTVEEMSKQNLGNLVKYLPVPQLTTILESKVLADVIEKTGEKYHQ